MSWKPLLEGPLAAEAHEAVRAIALDIAAATPPHAADPADRTLFWAYVTNHLDEKFAHEAYDAAMDDLVATLQHGVTHASLYDGGLAGIGWVLQHVLDGGAEDVLEVIDEAITGVIDVDRWASSNDLCQGLVGYGVYFLERLAANPNAGLAFAGLHKIIAHLDRNAIKSDHGAAWLTSYEVMPDHYRSTYPEGFHDCGLAHGAAGMISFLDRAARLLDDGRARKLSRDALHWLALRRMSPHPMGRFPAMVPPALAGSIAGSASAPLSGWAEPLARGSQPAIVLDERSRAAWCYGDPGVAAAVWGVSPTLARETALDCARRDADTTGCRDAAVCHGTVGLAHLYNRFYQATGEQELATSAHEWYRHTLALRQPGTGVGGFSAWRGEQLGDVAAHHLVDGAIGIGLALLAGIAPTEPNWDRIMLCDVGGGQ